MRRRIKDRRMWTMNWVSSDSLGEREVEIRVPFQLLLVVGLISSNPLLNQKRRYMGIPGFHFG